MGASRGEAPTNTASSGKNICENFLTGIDMQEIAINDKKRSASQTPLLAFERVLDEHLVFVE